MEVGLNANERRCIAETKRGRCKVVRGLNAKGLCPMHAGTTDPRDLGRRSGEARRKPSPERVHPGLREYLKREADPAEVWLAIQRALQGGNESARISGAKLLLDALHEPHQQQDDTAEREAISERATEKLEALVRSAVVAIVRGDPAELQRQPVWVQDLASELKAGGELKVTRTAL
ncbi:MAG TPA: hypothetical protein VKC65_04975 [Gaiellaceae bacterium]|nr:hypothetical protein [Gaiellaceae bacterium]